MKDVGENPIEPYKPDYSNINWTLVPRNWIIINKR